MTEEQDQTDLQQDQTDLPHDDELDVEAPNESAPGHNPPDADDEPE